MAPADAGGGWDSTARALQQALDDSGVTSGNIEVYNRPGAGGTTGLAEFTSKDGQVDQLMVMGLVMLGAIQTNDAPVGLDAVTPIASLTAEYEALVVRADSEYQTVEDLLADFRADPRSISWGSGSAGGTDHILVGLVAEAMGADPADVNYIAHSGGGEALGSILSGGVTVGVSGISEFEDQVAAGELRYLATSSPDPIDASTLPRSARPGSKSTWRTGVASLPRPGSPTTTARSSWPRWRSSWPARAGTRRSRDSFVHVGDDFDAFLADEEERVGAILERIGLA